MMTDNAVSNTKTEAAPNRGKFRISGLQGKLIIPYVVLTMVIAAVGIFVITRLVTSTIRERFVNQIYEAARVASDTVVRHEKDNLENLRVVAYTQGVADALAARDVARLDELLTPLALNYEIDAITLIDPEGTELLTIGRAPESNQFVRTQGTSFAGNELVRKILLGVVDEQGDKFVDILETEYGPALFTGAPVYNNAGEIVGGVMVGANLNKMQADIKTQALVDVIFFDQDWNLIVTTLMEPNGGFGELETASQSVNVYELPQTFDLTMYDRDFQITYAELAARNEKIGWLGVVLPSNYVVSTEATSRNLISLVFALGTVAVILIGYFLSQSIARPILKLRSLSQAVAAGDLEQQSGLKRADEIGELAEAFDQMTLSLRDRTQEAARLYDEAVQRNIELAEINERLRSTQQQLIQSEKLAAIGQLSAGIVHDIKNPLAVIKGVTELLLSEEDGSEEFRQELTLINDSATKANNIVSDLMKFARQSELEMGEYDMRDTIEAVLRLMAFPIRKAHVKVIQDLPDDPIMMSYDYQQIEQVLLNLVSNAIQAMSDGGTLRVNLSRSQGTAAISVQDTGMGIPPENINRIFDPFFTTKPEGEGTGLGLSVSYGIVSKHNGHIQVESVVGEGTTFTILLPIEHAQAMEAA